MLVLELIVAGTNNNRTRACAGDRSCRRDYTQHMLSIHLSDYTAVEAGLVLLFKRLFDLIHLGNSEFPGPRNRSRVFPTWILNRKCYLYESANLSAPIIQNHKTKTENLEMGYLLPDHTS